MSIAISYQIPFQPSGYMTKTMAQKVFYKISNARHVFHIHYLPKFLVSNPLTVIGLEGK